MAPNSENEIEISVTYWIGGKDSETYSQRFSGVETRKLGGGLTKQSKLSPGDYSYSGRHDSGILPPLQEHAELCKLLACVKRAKDFNDRFVTEKIQELKSRELIEGECNPPSKKTKV